ncbi:hypothetical protein imdm_1634 [gamma proteobacterium IMCC2047]|nr:hypothetical protein imdm_1634 [gamma proteobacterium IMCC2047]
MNLSKRVQISRRVTLTSYAALLAALITGWIADQPSIERLDVLFIQTVPLLIFLPGMLRGNSMVHLYMSCVLLLYIIMSVTNLMLGKALLFSTIESVASITLFTATMLFVRYSRMKRAEQSNT